MTEPVVTVCIPTWQAEAFIDQTLGCARNQTYPRLRIMILVSVDHSDDRTTEICQRHAREDRRVEGFAQGERLGWARNINFLLDQVTSEYFFIYPHDFLNDSPRFDNVSGALHDPLEGYEMLEPSYKSRDEHTNIQVTLMQHTDTQELAADIDIDEARGLQHGFEVLRNKIGKRRTNPYLVREMLLAGDPLRRSLDPKYRFVFKHGRR